MHDVDFVDLAVEVLPRRWVRLILRIMVVLMLLTGSSAPFVWYATHKAAALDQDLMRPMLSQLATLATPRATDVPRAPTAFPTRS